MASAKTQHRLADYLTDKQVELIHVSDVLKHFVINLKRGERKACGGAFHPEVSFFVVEGEGTIFIGDEAYAVKAGDLLVCPQGKSHAFTAMSDKFSIFVSLPQKQ